MEKKIIDAEGKRIGRVASEAAKILMGKQSASYAQNKVFDVSVEIINASKAEISEKKKDEKTYSQLFRLSGRSQSSDHAQNNFQERHERNFPHGGQRNVAEEQARAENDKEFDHNGINI